MLLALLIACGGDEPAATTYHADVRPLLERRCGTCHTDGNIAPFPLTTYDEVHGLADLVVDSVENRRMPPWDQDPDCRPSEGSQWLTDDELAVFAAWRDGGFSEGDESDYVAPAAVPQPEIPAPALELSPVEPYTPSDSSPDDYRCQILTTPLESDLFITGVAVEPDQVAMAHHAILYGIPSAHADTLAQLESEDSLPGYRCFGDPGLQDAQTLGGWVPGRGVDLYGPGVAQRVAAGSILVLQMHYNTAAVDTIEPDASTAQIWTLPDGELPTQLLSVFPVAKTGLDIAAGDDHSQQISTQRIPANAQIVGTAPHMHLLGTRLQTKLIRADGTEECLTDVAYDFDWQRQYTIPPEHWVPLSPDDRLEITCTYDNSATNQPMVDGERTEPARVTWGDGTNDEMCLNYMALLSPYLGSGSGEVCDGVQACRDDCGMSDSACDMACMMTAGDPCLYCGMDAMFSDCTIQACLTEVIPVGACMDECSTEQESQIDCLLGECNDLVRTYWECRNEAVASGACPEDGATCPGL